MYRQNQTTPSRAALQDNHNGRPARAPERPIVPYIRYSRKMWPKIRQENPDSQLWDIGKIVSQNWKDASEAEKAIYQQEYEVEKLEYEKAMKIYHNSSSYQQYMHAKGRGIKMDKPGAMSSSRKGMAAQSVDSNSPGVVIQPLDEEDPFELTGKRLAAIRFDRNNRFMSELFSSSYVPDTRHLIPRERINTLQKQTLNLTNHQTKMNLELERLDENFKKRKQAMEESSLAFMTDLKKIVDEKPELSEERYNGILKEHQEILLNSFEEYKKRQEAIRTQLEAERRETPVLYSLTCEKSPSPGHSTTSNNPSSASQHEHGEMGAADEDKNPTSMKAMEVDEKPETT